ncbi:unnamed protein product [Closterium sp. NIES-64]|nr:unnamed protein product [Closterium sp. NIES-64]
MEVRLVNGMVLTLKMEETAGGVGERVATLEAKLREQGGAMAAMQRDMADMRHAMALLKGMGATGALGEKSAGEWAGNGSDSREAAEGIGAQPARDAASEMRGEIGAVKAELARVRAAAERQVAEVAYVKATAAHSKARINDVELALTAIKERPAEKSRAKREAGSAGEDVVEERREGKRRKREEAGENEGGVAAGAGLLWLPSVVRMWKRRMRRK